MAFQPYEPERAVSPGKKTNWPVAAAAVNPPTTNPRRLTNQRFATVAANTNAIEPVPIPTITPHVRTNCHGACTNVVKNAPVLTVVNAAITTLRTVKRSINAAANGAVNPYNKTLIAIASEIWSRPQPNASSSGTINTEGADLKPAVATRVKKVTIAAIHAG